MDKPKLDAAIEIAPENETGNESAEIRILRDLELVLVGGGGDDAVTW